MQCVPLQRLYTKDDSYMILLATYIFGSHPLQVRPVVTTAKDPKWGCLKLVLVCCRWRQQLLSLQQEARPLLLVLKL